MRPRRPQWSSLLTRKYIVGDPVAAFGATYTPVARAHSVGWGRSGFALGAAVARPHHIEIVTADGTTAKKRIRDPHRALVFGVQVAALLALTAVRARRRMR